MPEPFTPQVQRNYLDDILDQAYNDLDMERQRQESIIQSDNPDKVLSQQNKVEKQLENEVPEVQKAVRQKVYRPGYFDVSRTAEDILPGKTEKDELPYDELLAQFQEYNEKLPAYTAQEYDRISQEKLGSQRPTTSRMRMADYEGQPYTEEDIKNEALSSAKARLSEEGLIKPKATGITALKETFTDWNKFGKKLPWIGGGGEAMEAFGLINAIRDVKDGTADEDDYRVLIEAQMEMERDSDWTNMATEIFLTLPGYAIEFASTGSMATGARVATKAGVRKSLNWVLSKQGKKLIKEGSESFALRATQGVLGTTVGAVARTINPKTWNRTLGNATQQMIPDYELDQAQNGKIEVIADEFKDWGTALTEGALLTFTENLGEEFGEVFAFGGKEFRAYMKTNPESAVSGLIKSIIRKNPNVPVGKVMQSVRQAGIHSVPVEILEERVTDFLQSGIEGHEFHWPTPEEWLAEIVAIGGFAGGARGIGKIADSRTRKRKESAKQKGLSAIESGTLDQLTNDEMTDFATSLTKEEAMELGVIPDYENQRINYEPESDLGKEMIRRNLEMEKFSGTDEELREAGARANIKQQQMEGRDFVGALMNKVREEAPNIDIQDEYLDRLLSDEAQEKGWTEEEIKQQLRDHGLDEDSDPEKIMITGASFGGSIRISRAGTEERMVDEYVAVTEEMAEEYYKAEQENNPEFDNEVSNDRKNYNEATGEQDKGESNLEWFSTKAIHFATQGKVHESIGAKLKQIFNRFIAESKAILMDAIRLRKAIKAGKVSDSLLKKLEEATDFKKVGEKVKQAKESKKQPTYRTVRKPKGKDVLGRDIPDWRGATVFHSTDAKSVEDIKQKGYRTDLGEEQGGYYGKAISFTPDIEYTKQFGDIVTTAKISEDAKILNQNDPKDSKVFDSILKGRGFGPDMHQYFLDAGIDGVYDPGAGDLFIYNPKVVTYESSKPNSSYRMSIAEGMEKLRTKPALRAPAKDEKLSKGQIKNRIKRLKRDVLPEIEEFGKTNKEEFDEAIEWYFNDIRVAIDILANETPYVKDHPALFTAIIAITSNGQRVPGQYNDTADVLDHFVKNNSFPIVDSTTTGDIKKPIKVLKLDNGRQLGGARPGVIGQSMNRLQYIIDQLGVEGAEQWLLEPKSGIEIHEMAWASGTYKQGNGMPGVSKDQKKRNDKEYRGMHIFGRKIGNFGLAFSELNKDAVIDVWMSRWYNRHMGTPFNKQSGELQESPRNPGEWDLISQGVNELTEEFNKRNNKDYTKSQIQAVIWYHEKYYYEKNGINFNKGINYSRSANERAKQKGYFKDSEELVPVSDATGKEQEGSQEDTRRVSEEKPSYRLAPTFYSKAERVVTEQFPATMKSQSVENFLLKNQVKPEEIQWLDLETLTRNKPKITKEELQDWIQANKIDVQDVVLGELQDDSKIKDQLASELDWFANKTITLKVEGYEDEISDRFIVKQIQINNVIPVTEIREVRKSAKNDYINELVGHFNDIGYSLYPGKINKKYEPRLQRLHELEKEIKEQENIKRKSETRHSQYQLPGEKEDYRELLLTLPMGKVRETVDYKDIPEKVRKQVDHDLGSLGFLTDQSHELLAESGYDIDYNLPAGEFFLGNMSITAYKLKDGFSKSDQFTTGHYDEPNILAHVRFNTRKSPTGEQVLFIEELQSDWHTQGRKKGYSTKWKIPESWEWKNEIIASRKVVSLYNAENVRVRYGSSKAEIIRELENAESGVPDAPFKNNGWIELIMKRMLRYASENNFDRIAWTTANQQIDRWSDQIRQNVDQIHWQKNDRQAYADWVYGGRQGQFIAGGVVVNGLKKNNSVFNQTIPIEGETTINGQKVTLEGLLGKQMATQIRNSDKPTGIIEGDNLTIGGQGFKTVYDFAIKKILNKMGKKFGAKVDQVELEMSLLDVVSGEPQLQPSIPVTRKMKESALKGQPTFRASKMTSTEDVLSSPSFKKWFKGSKVVDENGKPLVVYHGTTGNIEAFSKNKIRPVDSDAPFNGFWFTNETNTSPAWVNPTSILPVYLSIKNPAPFKVIYDEINKMPDYTLKEYEEMGVRSSNDLLRQKLQELGYDGVIFEKSPPFDKLKKSLDKKGVADWKSERGTEYVIKNTPYTDYNGIKRVGIDYYLGSGPYKSGYESYITGYGDFENFKELHSEETYVAFEPTQIKSVFNKGTFNPHDPRISFHMAPKNLVTPLAKIYQEQKGTKKSYTKKNFENDLVRLGYPDDTVKTAMDLFGIIRIKQIETDDPTPIEKELKKIQDLHITRSNLKTRIKRAYTLGAVEKEKEIKKLQKIITKYARDNMPIGEYKKSEVTGLLAKVRDAKRAQQLAPALERIDRVIDKVQKRSALSKWNKTVKKKAKVKKVSGIVQGTVGPDVQDIVNDIRRYHKLSPAEIDDKLDDLGKVMTVNEPTEENLLKQKWLLTFGAMKHKTPEEITKATEVFDLLVTKGRVLVMEEQQAYKERMLEVVSEILDIITGGAGPQSQGGAQNIGLNKRTVIADIKEKLSSFDSEQQSLEYIFDKLSRLDKTSKPLESFINNYFMPQIRQARLSEYNGIKEMQALMIKKLEEIYGLKGWKLRTKMNENSVNTISIEHHDGMENDMKGPLITSELTYNEAYKKWMELRDPTLHPTFEKMGWDIEKAKRQIEDQLPKEIMEWANWQLYEFYPMYYQRVNETFRRRFYVNMPFNPAYSPITRMVGGQVDEGDVTLQNAKSTFSSVHSAGSLKGRVSNTEELVWIDGDAILNKHIAEMEHFIAYTDVIREMRSVFMNRSVSNSIKNFHGTGIRRVLNKMMDDLARGGVDKANNIEALDKWRIAFTKAVIGVNPIVYLKQLASIPAYMSDIPMLDWSKEFAKLMNPIELKRMYRTLSKSKMIDMRYDKGFERDMVSTLNSVRKQRFTDSDSFTQLLFFFTKMGDKQAIFLGGWPVYKYHYKNAIKAGKSKEEAGSIAMKKFESSSQRSQQSGEVEDLSQWQRSGSIGKLFTMFMTSPNQYYRMVAGAVRNFHYGRGTKTENIRKIFVGAILLPQLFTFIANGFQWDEEDFWITLASWPWAGLMFVGKPIAWSIEYATKGIAWGKPGEIPVLDVFNDFGKAGKILIKDNDKLDMEAFFKAMLEMVEGITKIRFGIPVGSFRRTASGVVKVAKGEAQHPIREAIGFKFKGKKKKKKKKKAKVAQPMFLQ